MTILCEIGALDLIIHQEQSFINAAQFQFQTYLEQIYASP